MDAPAPEFSRCVALDGLPKGGRHFKLEASAEERIAVAKRLGAPAVGALSGALRVTAGKARFSVRGTVIARLTRLCVVSLEEIAEDVEETFEIDFVRRADGLETDDEEISLDSPEVHGDPQFDIGELLVQQLSLAMDPFPKKHDASGLTAEFATQEETSPFAQALGNAMKSDKKQ